jgi:hypothetical protein
MGDEFWSKDALSAYMNHYWKDSFIHEISLDLPDSVDEGVGLLASTDREVTGGDGERQSASLGASRKEVAYMSENLYMNSESRESAYDYVSLGAGSMSSGGGSGSSGSGSSGSGSTREVSAAAGFTKRRLRVLARMYSSYLAKISVERQSIRSRKSQMWTFLTPAVCVQAQASPGDTLAAMAVGMCLSIATTMHTPDLFRAMSANLLDTLQHSAPACGDEIAPILAMAFDKAAAYAWDTITPKGLGLPNPNTNDAGAGAVVVVSTDLRREGLALLLGLAMAQGSTERLLKVVEALLCGGGVSPEMAETTTGSGGGSGEWSIRREEVKEVDGFPPCLSAAAARSLNKLLLLQSSWSSTAVNASAAGGGQPPVYNNVGSSLLVRPYGGGHTLDHVEVTRAISVFPCSVDADNHPNGNSSSTSSGSNNWEILRGSGITADQWDCARSGGDFRWCTR